MFKLMICCFAFFHAVGCLKHSKISRIRGPQLESSHKGIYYGIPTSINKHPYLVSIHSEGLFLCVGTIVSRSWIVTLGDCEPRIGMAVRAGSAHTMMGGYVYKVAGVTMHPNFHRNTYDYDYACVRIYGSFVWSARVQPVKLPIWEPAPNTILFVAGWGYGTVSEVGDLDYEFPLLEGRLQWVSRRKCRAGWDAYGIPEWTDRMACVFDRNTRRSYCNGEWGDSVVRDGVFHGILASGSGTCTFSDVPVMVVTIAPITAWLVNVTGLDAQDNDSDYE